MTEIGVIERTVRTFFQARWISVRPVQAAVIRFKVEHAADVAVGVERQAPDPMLSVARKKKAAVVRIWKPVAPIDAPANDARIAPGMRIGVNGAGEPGRTTRTFAIRPAIVGAPCQ